MPLPLVTQLRFARSEFTRGLQDISPEDAVKRLGQMKSWSFPKEQGGSRMNCISWIVGHLANQENFYWVRLGRGLTLAPELNQQVGTGKPASTPPPAEMWRIWQDVTCAADEFLDGLTPELLATYFEFQGKTLPEDIGTLLLRNTYHYWFHLGEAYAIREMLGHANLPQYVGSLSSVRYE